MLARARSAVGTAIVVIVGMVAPALAIDDLTGLKPGDKLLVDFVGGLRDAEFVEYVRPGWLKARIVNAGGREMTWDFPLRKVRLARTKSDTEANAGTRGASGPTAGRALNDRTAPLRNRLRGSDQSAGAENEQAGKNSAPPAQSTLIGQWRKLPRIVDGKEIPGTGGMIVFQEGRLLLANLSGAYRIDPTPSPKHLDFSLGDDNLDVPYRGLYELEGNKLRICFRTTAGGARPTAFPAADGDGVELIVCERVAGSPKSSGPAQLDPGLKN